MFNFLKSRSTLASSKQAFSHLKRTQSMQQQQLLFSRMMTQRYFATVAFDKMRNIGISAHIDSGKTTFTERVLYYTGRIDSIHEVRGSDNVGATMDSMELEREKGITIQSAATHCQWGEKHINIIDTPGHVDFTIEVERALRVLDGAILLVCAASGVQPQTLTVDKQMRRYEVPRIIFINKMDRMGASPWKCIEGVRDRLGIKCAAVQVNIGIENGLKGLIDLIEMRAMYFDGDNGEHIRYEEIPADLLEFAQEKREELIAELGDVDEKIAEMFLDEEEITAEVLNEAIRRNVIANKFSPVFLGSAYKNKGIQPALDGVSKFLPAPDEITNLATQVSSGNKSEVELAIDNKKPFVGLAFKLEESKFGQLTYVRIYQGKIKKGAQLTNTSTKKPIKVSRMVRMHSNSMEDISEAGAGDIFALFGVDCASGETFTDGTNVTMTPMHVPEPVMSLTIKPKSKDDLDGFMKALKRFQREDPTFRVTQNVESEEIIISGMGELHLQIYGERLKREYQIPCNVGNPTVNYRETIGAKAEFNFLHKKQSGGAGQYAKVIGYMEPVAEDPTDPDADRTNIFENKLIGQDIPNEYIPAIEKAFHEACAKGPQTGYPVVGVRYVLQGGQTHSVDSSSLAFMIATKYSFTEAYKNGSPIILEPIMNVEVSVPTEFQEGIMGQLVKRRGNISNMESRGPDFIIQADVPLAAMFGYATELRGATQGLGEYSMEYSYHAPVGEYEIGDIIEAYQKKKKEAEDW